MRQAPQLSPQFFLENAGLNFHWMVECTPFAVLWTDLPLNGLPKLAQDGLPLEIEG
jgi:hypothetical protein